MANSRVESGGNKEEDENERREFFQHTVEESDIFNDLA